MAPPRVAAGLVAALLLAGRAADVVAQSHGSQPPSASLEDDLAILLAFRAVGANSQDNWVRTWAAGGGGPCDEASFDRENAGWKMVMCCASYDWSAYSQDGDCTGANARRVTYLNLYSLQVSGDIGPLGRLVELQNLDLHGTAVAGDVAALAALGQLQYLYLSDTAVWGRADALRAIPGLGAGWKQFIACSHTAYGDRTIGYFGLCPVGRSDVADAASYIGVDKCACCSGSRKMRDPTTGACVDLGESRPPRATRPSTHARGRITTRASPHSPPPPPPHVTAPEIRRSCSLPNLRAASFRCSSSAPVSF